MSHKTLIITSSIFVVIILVGVIISFTLLLHPNTPNRGGVASTSTQTTQSLVSVVPQRVVLGVLPNPQNSSAEVIPANTLVWVTYVLSNTTYLVGADTTFVATLQNYNTNVTIAVYVNSVLYRKETTMIPPPIIKGNSTGIIYDVGASVDIQSTIAGGSTITLPIISQAPITVYALNSGSTYESQIEKIPTELPTSASILPYLVEIYAFTNA
jgi:hypothetical protein